MLSTARKAKESLLTMNFCKKPFHRHNSIGCSIKMYIDQHTQDAVYNMDEVPTVMGEWEGWCQAKQI